ncbi:MAG: hypothetical protein MJZ84_07530 [Paludibacteraceae bacterium]|nr:hypothetical protein [Paludibacteraceae bacterium]
MTGIALTSDENKGYDLDLEIKRDANGKIIQGIKLAETTHQNQAFILMAHKGDFKEHPLLGVGIQDIINDNDFPSWERLITEQFEADGQQIDKLEITSKGLTLEAHYK